AGAQGQSALAGAGATTEGDDPDRLVQQQVDGDALLRAAPGDAEDGLVAGHQPDLLVTGDASQRGSAGAGDGHARVHGVMGDLGDVDQLAVVEVAHPLLVHTGGDHPGVAAVAGQRGPVL